MIAEVVPICRLRRATTSWSYTVLASHSVQAGSLVLISFRGRKTLGIVWEISETKKESKATLALEGVITSIPLLRRPQRELVEHLSQQGVCSLSTALFVFLPRALRKFPLTKSTTVLLKTELRIPTSQETALAKQHLILVPGKREQQAANLAAKFKDQFTSYFSDDLSEKEELFQWLQISQGKIRVVMGKERALFAPWLNLAHLTIIEPEDVFYAQEQSPSVHLLSVATFLAKITRAHLVLRSHLPVKSSKFLWSQAIGLPTLTQKVELTDLRKEALLGPSLIEKIQATRILNKEILILFNSHDRLVLNPAGGADSLLIPGVEQATKKLIHLLGEKTLPPEITIGTRSILHTPHPLVGLSVVLSLDPLQHEERFANRLHSYADLQTLLSYGAPLIIQSHQPGAPLSQALLKGALDDYIVKDIEQQQAQHLPPFGQLIACIIPEKTSTEIVQAHLEKITQVNQKTAWQVGSPSLLPFRGKKYWHILLYAQNSEERLPAALFKVLAQLPSPWRVLHNPWHII